MWLSPAERHTQGHLFTNPERWNRGCPVSRGSPGLATCCSWWGNRSSRKRQGLAQGNTRFPPKTEETCCYAEQTQQHCVIAACGSCARVTNNRVKDHWAAVGGPSGQLGPGLWCSGGRAEPRHLPTVEEGEPRKHTQVSYTPAHRTTSTQPPSRPRAAHP